MSQEPTTHDLVELTRRTFDAYNRRDFDAITRFVASDAVWEAVSLGTSFEGVAAIRGFLDDWLGGYEEFEFELEQILDFGNGVVFAMVHQNARPVASTGYVQMHHANVMVWVNGVTARAPHYNDIDEARAAAERLAEERAQSDA